MLDKIAGNEISQSSKTAGSLRGSENHSKKCVWGKFLARILIPYLSSQPAEIQPEERII